MGVKNQNADFKIWLKTADKSRIVFQGEDSVKAAGKKFLPMLVGQNQYDYAAYKDRAVFYPYAKRVKAALNGALFRKDPQILIPPSLEYLRDEATAYGVSLPALMSGTCDEQLEVGRYGILVDIPEGNNKPMFVPYKGEKIINWRMGNVNGKLDLTLLVLQEDYCEPDPSDVFSDIEKTRYRVCKLTESAPGSETWIYTQEVMDESGTVIKAAEPTARGANLGYIPFVFFNTSNNLPEPQVSALYDLISINVHHYRWTAEEGHALHFTALPTPWIAGGNINPANSLNQFGANDGPKDQFGKPIPTEKAAPMYIGSSKAWSLPKDATVGMLEHSGTGISSIQEKINKLVEYMASLSARLFSEPSVDETATAVKIQKTSESNALSHIANTLDEGFSNLLTYAAQWIGESIDDNSIAVKTNREFISQKMSADEATKLFDLYLNNGIDSETLLYQYVRGEFLPPNVDLKAENARLQTSKNEAEQGSVVINPQNNTNPSV